MKNSTQNGHPHPLSILIRDIHSVFRNLGFSMADGPEMESEYYNFDALNVPKDHPSRDMQDTFWVKGKEGHVMRTHTSPVQARYMESHAPPLRIIVPGKVYRNEATDATHEAQFYQIEGLAVERRLTLGHLKWTLGQFFAGLFGKSAEVRFRPSFFPFVEPGVEVDMVCVKCGGGGCALCKGTGWIEMLGAGMVHPNVLAHAGIDPREWQGFAFGVGIERLGVIKYGIDDVRLFHNGDMRVVAQFAYES